MVAADGGIFAFTAGSENPMVLLLADEIHQDVDVGAPEVEDRVRREVSARLVTRDEAASFVVWTDRALWQQRLVKMGWHPQGSGRFERRVDLMPGLDAVFGRFERHLPLMLLHSSGQVEPDWRAGLHAFAERVEGSGVAWWLYGSTALAIRGIDVAPGDVDLAVNDAKRATAVMEPLLVYL